MAKRKTPTPANLTTWKAEYYPVEAERVKKRDALAHCLKKWIGLRARNLKRHGVQKGVMSIFDAGSGVLWIDTKSCAACVHWLYHEGCSCRTCPLYLVRGVPCYKSNGADKPSPFDAFTRLGNPEPMIRLIRKAMRHGKA